MSTFELPSMAHFSKRRFGNYRLVRLLGKGGFASVYLGEHIHLGTQAAIKVLRAWLTDTDVDKFYTEARIAAHLIHPHIVRVLEFGLEGRTPFLVMDYAPYGTLRRYHPRGERLDPETVIAYVRQIAGALHYLHDNNLIHQDIKPENLLLGDNSQVLLSDFGIAMFTHKVRASRWKAGAGTIAYMAPEQIRGEPCLASDQYALGVVVYEWLCGVLPFQGSSSRIMHQHLSAAPPPLSGWVPTIPPAVEDVVLRALAKDPRRRFGSVQEFALALEEAYEDSSSFEMVYVYPAVNGSVPARPPRARGPKRRNIWKEISSLFAIDLLVGAAVWIVLYLLGVAPQSLWFLFSLSVISLPLVWTLIARNLRVFMLTSGMLVSAALLGIVFHSLALFLVLWLGLLVLIMLAAFTTSIHSS